MKYHRALAAARLEKQAAFTSECPLLTYVDIQECVDIVNQQCQEDTEGEPRERLRKLKTRKKDNPNELHGYYLQ